MVVFDTNGDAQYTKYVLQWGFYFHIPLSHSSSRLRPLVYPGTHVFVICYDSVTCQSCMLGSCVYLFLMLVVDHIWSREDYPNSLGWFSEVTSFVPNACVLLVGTKTDLRHNVDILKISENTPVSPQYFSKKCSNFGLLQQMLECSAMNQENIERILAEAYTMAKFKAQEQASGPRTKCEVM